MKISKKTVVFIFALSFLLLAFKNNSFAQTPTEKEELSESQEEKSDDPKEKLKNQIARLNQAEVTKVDQTTITVTAGGKTYTVKTDSNTKFRRLFWGKGELAETTIGNKVNILGTWTDYTQITIQAKMIRNLSVMKRLGVFFGTIKSKTETSFTMETINRGELMVIFETNTKFIARNETTLKYTDLNIGDKVRIKGLWDKSLNKITKVTVIKDFSLPVVKVTPSVTP